MEVTTSHKGEATNNDQKANLLESTRIVIKEALTKLGYSDEPLLVAEAAMVTKFIIGVVCVSQIIFFSALIPCILATEIPISISKLLVIWLERTILNLIIVIPIAHFLS